MFFIPLLIITFTSLVLTMILATHLHKLHRLFLPLIKQPASGRLYCSTRKSLLALWRAADGISSGPLLAATDGRLVGLQRSASSKIAGTNTLVVRKRATRGMRQRNDTQWKTSGFRVVCELPFTFFIMLILLKKHVWR